MEKVIEFLTSVKLQAYSQNFEQEGYDDMEFIESMSETQINVMLINVGMSQKPGHKQRFFAGLSIRTSKQVHGVPNQADDDKTTKTVPEIWPENVSKLLVPNPLSEKIAFGNDLLSELYNSIYPLLSPEQFKNYFLSQKLSRWSINQDYQNMKTSLNILEDPNSKDGNAKHFQRLCSKDYSVKAGDKTISENTKSLLDTKMDRLQCLLKQIKDKRSKLFNESNETKPWKFNELKFYDDIITNIKNLEKTLLEKNSILISNIETINRRLATSTEQSVERKRKLRREKEGKRKEKKAKESRTLNNCRKLLSQLTNGKVQYNTLQENRKLQLSEINLEAKLTPRFHLKPLIKLIEEDLISTDAMQIIKEMQEAMERQMSTKKPSKQPLKGNQKTLFHYLSKQPTSSSAPSSSSSSRIEISESESDTSSSESDIDFTENK